MVDLEALLNVDTRTPRAGEAVDRALRQSPLRRIAPAAIRELVRLDRKPPTAAAAAGNVAKRWLDILRYHPDLQDPLLGVRRAQRRLNLAKRRSDLVTEVRSMLQNEGIFDSHERERNRAAGIRGVVDDPTVEQLRLAIRAMASPGDQAFLMNYFTDARILRTLEGLHDMTDVEYLWSLHETEEVRPESSAGGSYGAIGEGRPGQSAEGLHLPLGL